MMFGRSVWPGFAAAAVACVLAAAARADDCAPVKAGMLKAVRTPHTTMLTRLKDGKPVTSRMVQTADTRYIELNGTWRSMPFSAEDAREMEQKLDDANVTCSRVGSDSLDGKPATVYAAHIKNEDMEFDAKLWLGTDGLPLKVDNANSGNSFSSTYDYAHADPPANAKPMGTK